MGGHGLTAAAVHAAFLPARRAKRKDPLVASRPWSLRYQGTEYTRRHLVQR